MFTSTRPSSQRYQVAALCGEPSGLTDAMTAGFGRRRKSSTSAGTGGFGMAATYPGTSGSGAGQRGCWGGQPERLPRDDEPLDLGGALVDLGDLGVAVVALHRELAGVAVAAEHLDRVPGHLAGDLRGKQLGRGALEGVRAAGGLGPR